MLEQSPERRERSAIIAKAKRLARGRGRLKWPHPPGRGGRQQLLRAERGRRQGPQDRRQLQCSAKDVDVVG